MKPRKGPHKHSTALKCVWQASHRTWASPGDKRRPPTCVFSPWLTSRYRTALLKYSGAA